MKTATVKLKVDMAMLRELKDQLIAAQTDAARAKQDLARERAASQVHKMAYGKALKGIVNIRERYEGERKLRMKAEAEAKEMHQCVDELRDEWHNAQAAVVVLEDRCRRVAADGQDSLLRAVGAEFEVKRLKEIYESPLARAVDKLRPDTAPWVQAFVEAYDRGFPLRTEEPF